MYLMIMEECPFLVFIQGLWFLKAMGILINLWILLLSVGWMRQLDMINYKQVTLIGLFYIVRLLSSVQEESRLWKSQWGRQLSSVSMKLPGE